jgi:hypothetical protein
VPGLMLERRAKGAMTGTATNLFHLDNDLIANKVDRFYSTSSSVVTLL